MEVGRIFFIIVFILMILSLPLAKYAAWAEPYYSSKNCKLGYRSYLTMDDQGTVRLWGDYGRRLLLRLSKNSLVVTDKCFQK